jgi:hypothetical protein
VPETLVALLEEAVEAAEEDELLLVEDVPDDAELPAVEPAVEVDAAVEVVFFFVLFFFVLFFVVVADVAALVVALEEVLEAAVELFVAEVEPVDVVAELVDELPEDSEVPVESEEPIVRPPVESSLPEEPI